MTENIILNHNVVNEIFSSDCSCALIFSRHSSVSSGGSWWGKKAPWPSEGFKHIEENHDAPNPHLTVDLNIFQPWRLDHIWISKDQRIVGFSSSNIHPEIYNRQQRCNNYTPKHQMETWRFCFKSLKKNWAQSSKKKSLKSGFVKLKHLHVVTSIGQLQKWYARVIELFHTNSSFIYMWWKSSPPPHRLKDNIHSEEEYQLSSHLCF